MIVDADAIHEEGEIQVAILVRRINPAQKKQQRGDERQNTERINFHDHGLTPHVAVETEQQTRHETAHDADGVLPFTGDLFQISDAFHQHAAAARDEQSQQSARNGSRRGFSQSDAPRDVSNREEVRPQPGIDRPYGIAGRMRNARIQRSDSEFAGVFQAEIGSERPEISRPDEQRGDKERHPINPPEQRRSICRDGFGRFG